MKPLKAIILILSLALLIFGCTHTGRDYKHEVHVLDSINNNLREQLWKKDVELCVWKSGLVELERLQSSIHGYREGELLSFVRRKGREYDYNIYNFSSMADSLADKFDEGLDLSEDGQK